MLVPRLIQTVSWADMLMLAVLILSTLVARSDRGLRPDAAARHGPAGREHRHGLWRGHRLGRLARRRLAGARPRRRRERQPCRRNSAISWRVLTTGFVLFTLLVNGISLRPLVKLLGLDKLPPAEQALARSRPQPRAGGHQGQGFGGRRRRPARPAARGRGDRGIRPADRRGQGRPRDGEYRPQQIGSGRRRACASWPIARASWRWTSWRRASCRAASPMH